jgi:hypothetical protein
MLVVCSSTQASVIKSYLLAARVLGANMNRVSSDTWLIFSDENKPVSGVLKNKLDLLESMYRLRVGVPQAKIRSR